jgi:hypothetical protein
LFVSGTHHFSSPIWNVVRSIIFLILLVGKGWMSDDLSLMVVYHMTHSFRSLETDEPFLGGVDKTSSQTPVSEFVDQFLQSSDGSVKVVLDYVEGWV